MLKERIQLTEELLIETYPFSEYITCVEVFLNGQSFNAFCSDNEIVQEWKENPDMLVELCKNHMLQQPKKQASVSSSQASRIQLPDGLEVESYSFSEDIYCMNVYQHGALATSFCSDRHSIDEWKEDQDSLYTFVNTILKK